MGDIVIKCQLLAHEGSYKFIMNKKEEPNEWHLNWTLHWTLDSHRKWK